MDYLDTKYEYEKDIFNSLFDGISICEFMDYLNKKHKDLFKVIEYTKYSLYLIW